MSLLFAYFIPMNEPYHTSVNSKKEGERESEKDSMDDDDERYSLPDVHIYALFLFDSRYSAFFFLLFIILNE
jgi:hypothetical protein